MQQDIKILVVDSNSDVHEMFQSMLTGVELTLFHDQELETSQQFIVSSALSLEEALFAINKDFLSHPYSMVVFNPNIFGDIPHAVEAVQKFWNIDRKLNIILSIEESNNNWHEIFKSIGYSDKLLIIRAPIDEIELRQLTLAVAKKWELNYRVGYQVENLNAIVSKRTAELEQALSMMQATIESTADGILVINHENTVTLYNKKLLAMLGVNPDKLNINNGLGFLNAIAHLCSNQEEMIGHVESVELDSTKIYIGELNYQNNNFFEYYSSPQYLKESIIGRIWVFRDVTQRKVIEARLSYQTSHDQVTQLPNRTMLVDRISMATGQVPRTGFALLVVDLQNFKMITDLYGMGIGNEILRKTGDRLQECLREEDVIARLGDSEFAIMLTDIKREQDVYSVIQKIMRTMAQVLIVGNHDFKLNACMGACLYPKDGMTTDQLLRNAATALYRARSMGPQSYHFFSPEINESINRRLSIETALNKGLERDQFFLVYQPIIDAKTELIAGVEALIRWQHPALGLVSPLEFISIAEENGMIVQMGDWILETVCRQKKKWREMGMPPIYVSVNLSAVQLRQQDLLTRFKKIITDYEVPVTELEFEVTETSLIYNINEVLGVLNAFKENGLSLAIDDFGVEYSSLNYLGSLPVGKLKIDQSFIKDLDRHQKSQQITRAIIHIAHNMDLKVVAEGVETDYQLRFLQKNECDLIQGYLFGKPMSPHEIEQMALRDQEYGMDVIIG